MCFACWSKLIRSLHVPFVPISSNLPISMSFISSRMFVRNVIAIWIVNFEWAFLNHGPAKACQSLDGRFYLQTIKFIDCTHRIWFNEVSVIIRRMVLVLNGVLQEECPLDTHSLFMQHPVYRDTANQLLSIPIKTVNACQCTATHDTNSSIVNLCRSAQLACCTLINVKWRQLHLTTKTCTSSARMTLQRA